MGGVKVLPGNNVNVDSNVAGRFLTLGCDFALDLSGNSHGPEAEQKEEKHKNLTQIFFHFFTSNLQC